MQKRATIDDLTSSRPRLAPTSKAVYTVFFLTLMIVVAIGCYFVLHKSCFVTPLEGTIWRDGKPVAGAEVVQIYMVMGRDRRPLRRTTFTNTSGEFGFPGDYGHHFRGMFEPIVSLEIIVNDRLQSDVLIWQTSKNGYEAMEEIGSPQTRRASFFPEGIKGEVNKDKGKLVMQIELPPIGAKNGPKSSLLEIYGLEKGE